MSEEKTIKSWKLDYQVLPITLTVFYGEGMELEDVYGEAKKEDNSLEGSPAPNWRAFVAINGSSVYLFINSDITPYILAHESVHIVKGIFDYIGSTLEDSSEEFFAYYLGYTFEELIKVCRDEFKVDIKL